MTISPDDIDAIRAALKDDFSAVLDRMEEIQDQMLRAFGMTEESIRKDCAHADEVAAIDTRLTKVERHIEAA